MIKLKKALKVLTIIVVVTLVAACGFMAPTETRQWKPTPVNDFKSVAGRWEGRLTSDDPKTLHFDRATVVIDDTGTCESSVTRTMTTVAGKSVDYHVISVFSEQGKLILTDGKLSTKFQKGGRMTLELYVDPATSEPMLRADAKNSQGFTYTADLERTGDSASTK
jgi:hypothetical protein